MDDFLVASATEAARVEGPPCSRCLRSQGRWPSASKVSLFVGCGPNACWGDPP